MAVVITPEKGQAARIGKVLLGLASDPKEVRWVTNPVAGFLVPQELYELFEQGMAALKAAEGWAGEDLMPVEPIERVPQEPRKRGRPKKAVPAVEEGQEE